MWAIYAFIIILFVRMYQYEHMTSITGYCINLDDRPDKWNMFNKHYWNLNIQRVRGIDGKTIPLNDPRISKATKADLKRQHENGGFRESHAETTLGGVGCTLAHAKAWEQGLRTSAEYFVVFEDDAFPMTERFGSRVEEALIQNTDFDVLLLGWSWKETESTEVENFMGLFGYVISRTGAETLLQHVIPVTYQIDHVMSQLSREGKLRIKSLPDAIVSHQFTYTDIQSDLTN